MDAVFTIGIFLSFFLQFLLLSKKNRSTSDTILAVWMFVFGLHLFSYYLFSLGYWDRYPHLVGIHHPFPLLHGPLLYLYIQYSLRSNQRFQLKSLVHFAPFIAMYIYLIPFFFFYSAEQKTMQNAGLLDDYVVFSNVSLAAFILSGIGYSIASYRLLNRYRRLTDQNFAFRKSIDLSWLKFFIYGSAGIFSFVSVITVLDEFTNINFGFNAELIFYTLLILFILYLGYSGIRHQSIFSGEPETDNQVVTPPAEESGYTRSGLNDDEGKRHHAKLIELMSTKKPYLEPKLSLSELADQLDISPNHLSQVINQFEEKNFFDFINAYRVNEFKTRALKPENKNYSILAIAYDSGFNSKSTFNHVFKKMEGSTPSAYLKSAKSA